MTKKQFIRSFIFCIVAICVFLGLASVLKKKNSDSAERFNTFYEEEKNSLDAVYIGSSGTDRYWNGPLAYHDYGMAVYPLTTNSQPVAAIKGCIREVLKTQNPKVFIIEIRSVRKEVDQITDSTLHHAVGFMKPSFNRIKTTKEIMDFRGYGLGKSMEFYIPLIKFHSRWVNLEKYDFVKKYSDLKGTWIGKKASYMRKPMEFISEPTQIRTPIQEKVELVLRDLLEYCNENKLKILFVASPFNLEQKAREEFNYTMDLVSQYGYPYIDFNQIYDEVGIDFSMDFYNKEHVNIYGSEKYTRYLAEYLLEHYDIKDKRGDKIYESWETSYQKYENLIKNGKQKWDR